MSMFTRMANRFIKRIVPPVNTDWFTEYEAAHESWEPYELTDPEPPSGVSVNARRPGHHAPGAAGTLHPDVELLMSDVDRYFHEINP
jgi:hypothetical protein